MLIDTERVVVGVVGLVAIWISHLIWRWMNPKCANGGILPPGSMGFPLIGETLSLIRPSYSLDLHPFLKKRIQRYGPIFKTSIAGNPVVVSADAEVNSFLLQQEGRLVELWYMDTFSKVFALEGESRISAVGGVHKYMRTIFLTHFGGDTLKNLIPHIQQAVDKTLNSWSMHDSVEVKTASSALTLDFSAKHAINYEPDKSKINLAESYHKFSNLFMSFPLNIPGTAFNQGLKVQKSLDAMFRAMLKERLDSPEPHRKDFLGQVAMDIDSEEYLTEDFMVNLIFIGLFGTFETISTTLALAFKLLSDHPRVVEEIIEEHELILKKREDRNSSLTWEECKSMTFTLQVINETLRLTSHTPGLIRKTRQDIPTKKGFTIPKGWAIILLTSSLHFNPNTYKNPLEFNPWRWKELDSHVVSKNFMAFGGGGRQCAGSEYSRMFMATFFHVLFTKYSWKKVKMGQISRNPIMQFGHGIHIKVSKKLCQEDM